MFQLSHAVFLTSEKKVQLIKYITYEMNMKLGFLLYDAVVEFPKIEYLLTVNKSKDSDYEYVTLSSSYKQTASYFFRWFRNMQSSCTAENASEKIRAMIDVFRSYKDELFVALRNDVLIDGIIQTCFDLQLEDSNLICEVLNLMHESWGSFGPLHFKAVFGRRRRKVGHRFPDFLPFFLKHAKMNKLEYNGVRMIDVSIYSSIEKSAVALSADVWRWKEMLVYLQYGARLENLIQDPAISQYGLSLAVTEILRTLIEQLWSQLVSPFVLHRGRYLSVEDYCASVGSEVKNLCRTLNIILRSIRRIQFRSLNFIIRDMDDQRNIILLFPSSHVMRHDIVKIMIPKLMRRYEDVEELKHVCRWTIRKRLNENWLLPHGIQDLPVPRKVRRYLNLLTD